ncbi:MAG: hypothetical protein LBF67_02830 [Prevotellaceae bacterium]|nr:hypothetical protein [Prevotellaceae bacterium]
MRKIFTFSLALLAASSLTAQGILEHNNACIWGHSNRNTSNKGSALCAATGITYSLANVLKKAAPKHIDLLCFYGKIGKHAPTFYLFAPLTPGLNVVWEKQGGTKPYSAFSGPQKDPDGIYALKNWDVRNATKLKKVAPDTYDSANNLAELTFDKEEYIAPVQPGDVVAFETAAGKKGLIKILSIEDDPDKTDKAGEGGYQKLNISVKIQQ